MHKEVLKFIKAVRESFPDAAIIYQFGACYGFYQILKTVFKGAEAYYDEKNDHIITKIDGRYYEIQGEYVGSDGKLRGTLTRLTKAQHEFWETVASGQRVEFMLKKYNK